MPGTQQLSSRLRKLRDDAGLSRQEVEASLVLGSGWIEAFETGTSEPTLGTLAALLSHYGTDFQSFFADLVGDGSAVAIDRQLSATETGSDLDIHFPMGPYAASVTLANATLEQFDGVLKVLRDGLSRGAKQEAIAACFLEAVTAWPHINPSDLWYFLVSHAYQDNYNHPAKEAGREWGQSWKRASGWALEKILVEHYNPHLKANGVWLEMPKPPRLLRLMADMGITDASSAEKADVVVLGQDADGNEVPFGVVHVKASFAERRTDDVPLSQELIRLGYVSPLATMDCKASPATRPLNRGELGPAQAPGVDVSSKRLDIERDRKFDACFSYNANTVPTPAGPAAARIYVCDFANPDDAFSRHLLRHWRHRQGIED